MLETSKGFLGKPSLDNRVDLKSIRIETSQLGFKTFLRCVGEAKARSCFSISEV